MRSKRVCANVSAVSSADARIVAATATNTPPTLSSQGRVLPSDAAQGTLLLKSSLGTSAVCRVWLYNAYADHWFIRTDLGTAGAITTTTATNTGTQAIVVSNLHGADRIFIEVTTVTGANELLEGWFHTFDV